MLVFRWMLALALCSTAADAETRGEWFKSLMQPNGKGSCCDVADCRATNARFVDGHWEAELKGIMIPVPNDKILPQESIDGQAYLCSSLLLRNPIIYCFVKPGGQT